MENNSIVNNKVDEILMTENQKISAAREAPEVLDSDYDEKNLYQVDKMSLKETKEKLDWCKGAFEYKQNNSYGIENINNMTCLHNNEVKNIAECNLLYDIINRPKHGKKLNSHYYHIIHGCMNTRKGKAKF